MLKQDSAPNCCHTVGSTESSRMSLYAVVLIFPFTETKGPEPWKTSPDHYSSSTKHYSWHYALGQVAFSWHLQNPDSSVGLPDPEVWFITTENGFPLLQSLMAASFTPLQLTLGIVILGLWGAARPWKSISWSFHEFGSECCNRGQTIFICYALQHSVVPFCELVYSTTSWLSCCCS